jgi:TonB-linked SusC/RagA family outer membrane protein
LYYVNNIFNISTIQLFQKRCFVQIFKKQGMLMSNFLNNLIFFHKMKQLKLLTFLSLVTLFAHTAMAQQRITGTVTSAKDRSPLPGVSVVVQGTNSGSITDNDGKFVLPSVATGVKLVFSYVGFRSQEVIVSNQSLLNIELEEDALALSEVVVTALGIKKESKKLGYATTTVNTEQITENRSPNFVNSLQGKIAGVNISALGTGPGGSSKIRIRGQSSINGQNTPLIVINGIPIDNTNFGTNPGNSGSDSGVGVRGGGNTSDGGDGLSSVNPDDIESMTVLKGATAAALYGSRAKDGVLMITTKSRGASKGIGVSYNTNYTSETPLDFTDYQYEYGQGENGVRPAIALNPTSGQWSFGEKIAPGMTQTLFDGVVVPYVAQPSHISKFFKTGSNFTNTISLSSGGEKGGFNMSLANLQSQGIVSNNKFNRKSVNLGFAYDLSKRISFAGNVNYSNEYNKNPPNIANQDNSIPTALYNLANTMPLELMQQKMVDASNNEFVYSRFRNRTNPYFTLARQFQNIRRDRVFGNLSAKVSLTNWLSVQGRVGQDFWSRDQDFNNFPTGHASLQPAPAGFENGMFTQEQRRMRETNTDILIAASKKFGDFGLDVNLGGNQMYRRTDLNSSQATDFVVRDLYTIQNGRVKDSFYILNERSVNSVYSSADFSFKDFLFLNATARNDWFSTLSPENRSILYPSISGSFVFSQAFNSMPTWLNFGKVRVAYAEVGSDSDVEAYADNLFYGVGANLFSGQPTGGPSGLVVPNADLKPMRIAEREFGIELKLFNNRITFDGAIYKKLTSDQIVNAQISDASGYTSTRINSGKSQNIGQEFLLNIVPIRTTNFQWDITFSGSHNKTKVLSLLTDKLGERFTTGTHVFNGEQRQVVGQEMNQIYGFGFRRDANGKIVYGANGIALRTADLISYGSALPDWIGGITNGFTYKGISISALIDFKLGNTMLSGTNFNAVRHGLHKMTLPGRDSGGIVGEGVNDKGEVNAVKVNPQDYWSVVRSLALVEPIVYNGGYWKLRQITAGYDLSRFVPAKVPIKGLKLSLVANNVLLLKKWVDNIDPESFGYSSDNIAGMESTGLPTTRSIGFNLNVKF